MRVISGMLRGLKLESLPGLDTRPTLDRVKEALFSMLFDKCTDAVGLDLFSGSGALGIELLSRYGRECTFVDLSNEAIGIIRKNIAKAHLEDKAHISREDALSFVRRTDARYDLIFMDPPYASGLYENVLALIKDRGILAPGGYITCECDASCSISCEGFEVVKDKTYGKVRVCILKEAEQS